MTSAQIVRCFGGPDDPLMMRYHDEEWGVPLHDDRALFEFLVLEGFQAGLSWRTILHKRENFRRALHNFDVAKIARYTDEDRRRLLTDPGIVRNRLKIDAAISNAQRFLEAQREFGSFDSGACPCTMTGPSSSSWSSFQAGLSWRTILHKRENFRRALHNFDVAKIARYTDEDRRRLLTDPGIVRNRLKIDAAISNAQRFLEAQREQLR